jgi:hypothetical protein
MSSGDRLMVQEPVKEQEMESFMGIAVAAQRAGGRVAGHPRISVERADRER